MFVDVLRSRNININPPASLEAKEALKLVTNNDAFHALTEGIYSTLDGFNGEDFDEKSFLRIWPIRKIIESPILSRRLVPFMDFSLDSEVYAVDMASVKFVYAIHQDSFTQVETRDVLIRLVRGEFDSGIGIPVTVHLIWHRLRPTLAVCERVADCRFRAL